MTYNEASDLAERYNTNHHRQCAVITPPNPTANHHILLIVRVSYLLNGYDHEIVRTFHTHASAHSFIVSKPGKHQ